MSKFRMGWANTKMGYIQVHGKQVHLDPQALSANTLGLQGTESFREYNVSSLQVQLCFRGNKSYQPLIECYLIAKILMWDVCPHHTNVVTIVLNKHLGDLWNWVQGRQTALF